MITKEEFLSYERVRESGEVNMFAMTTVCELTDLDKETVLDIMKHYEEYAEEWL